MFVVAGAVCTWLLGEPVRVVRIDLPVAARGCWARLHAGAHRSAGRCAWLVRLPCPPPRPSVDGHTAAWRLRALHYDTLSLVHGFFPLDGPASKDSRPNETISGWAREPLNVSRIRLDRLPLSSGYAEGVAGQPFFSVFDYIRDHLGYRLEVAAASFPRVLRASSFHFAADVINYGFSAPVNPRPVQLVLLQRPTRPGHADTSFEEVWRSPSLANPVVWQPRVQLDPTYQLTRHRIQGNFTVQLPALASADAGGGAAGNLTLALVLPDARQQTHALDHRSCIQLANADTEWVVVGNEGMNVLGTVMRE